jgi:glycosyltransferase involved in cell wall biosynthesis
MEHVLEELQAQTFTDFEAILVNDGDDNQLEAMEAIADKDSRIRIVSLSRNSGVAAARNAGTEVASTNWVTYPDPDDYFTPNYVENLFKAADGTGVDMVCGGHTTLLKSSDILLKYYINVKSDPEIVNILDGYERIWAAECNKSAWNKLYNIDLMHRNKLQFDSDFVNAQDVIFNMRYFSFIRSVGLVRDCGYTYYYYDEGSNRSNYNPKWIQNHLEIIDLQEQLHRKMGWSEQRIIENTNKELVYDSIPMFRNYFAINSPLSISEATKKMKKEIFSNSKIINAITQWDFGNDHLMRLIQRLVRIRNARLTAITIKMLVWGKRHLGGLYAIIKPFYRGDK